MQPYYISLKYWKMLYYILFSGITTVGHFNLIWKWEHDQFSKECEHSKTVVFFFWAKPKWRCSWLILSGFYYGQRQRTHSDGIVLYLFKWLFHSLWSNRKLFWSAAFDLALLYHFIKQFCEREQSWLLWHDVSNLGCSIKRIILQRVH